MVKAGSNCQRLSYQLLQ